MRKNAEGLWMLRTVHYEDNQLLRDAGFIRSMTGTSPYALAAVAHEIIGSETTLTLGDQTRYEIIGCGLNIERSDGIGPEPWSLNRVIGLSGGVQLPPVIRQLLITTMHGRRFKTRVAALEALSIEYRQLCMNHGSRPFYGQAVA